MVAVKRSKITEAAPAEAPNVTSKIREVAADHDLEPVVSPAHNLQKALHQADFRSDAFRPRSGSNLMLILSLICVYTLAMLMMFGTLAI